MREERRGRPQFCDHGGYHLQAKSQILAAQRICIVNLRQFKCMSSSGAKAAKRARSEVCCASDRARKPRCYDQHWCCNA